MSIYLYAYVNRNFGDDMMLRLLCLAFPDREFLLFPPKRQELFDTISDIPNLRLSPITLDELSKRCDGGDTFIKLGGSMFIIKTKNTLINRLKELFYLKNAKKRGCRMAAIGCNTGPFASVLHRSVAAAELSLYDLVTTRDSASLSFIKSHTKCPDVRLYPDILFGMKEMLAQKERKQDGSLCISVFKGGGESYSRAMAALADSFVQKTGSRVKLLVFESDPNSDIVSAGKIYSLSNNKDKLDIILHDRDDQIIDAVLSSGYMVCARFHSIIMAIAAGIPFIPVTYSNKSENLLSDLSFDGHIYSIDKIDEMNIDEAVSSLLSGNTGSVKISPDKLCCQSMQHFDAISRLI